ncbi:MAG: helix-hairpin-helix domain-containing protein [Planctomycetes bacterium]|nr:helix-hairpin-helix domain-containing protein [Planctomycetota bacterium]
MGETRLGNAPWRLLARDQVALCVLGTLLIGWAGARYVLSYLRAPAPVRKLEAGEPIAYRVDINGAGASELDLLPGIGPAKAKRIVEFRDANGPFGSAADLAKVPGISRQCVEGLRGLVTPDLDAPPGEAKE